MCVVGEFVWVCPRVSVVGVSACEPMCVVGVSACVSPHVSVVGVSACEHTCVMGVSACEPTCECCGCVSPRVLWV